MQNNSWLDRKEFPFESKYLDLKNGRMHYVDEGVGQVLLFVHGTPTWSFLYRNFIKSLSKSNRCIAIDNIGFGLSENPTGYGVTPKTHSENLSQFINKLDLTDIVLVVHDFGGPIGLGAAIANHTRISKVIMFNTWLWETETSKDVQKIDKLINSFIGRFLYLKLNFSPKVLLKKGFGDKSKLTKQIHNQYISPFPTAESRMPLYNLAKTLLGSSDWYEGQWQNIEKLTNKKWLIIWGVKDTFLTLDYLKKWKTKVPNAEIIELESGHFVQEEKLEESVRAIVEFLRK